MAEGQRNETIFQTCRRVAYRGEDFEKLACELNSQCQPPLPALEVAGIVRTIQKFFKKSVKSLKDKTQKFSLTAVVESASDQWKATNRLKEEVLDLRKVPTVLLVGHMRKIFAAGWCVKDVLVALEQSPEGEVYQSRGASGMRSILAWLHLRVNAWKGADGVLPSSPTRVRRVQVEVERERLIE